MSSFASGNLISKEHQQWVIENMEENSYLLELNDIWLCYLTAKDNDIAWNPYPDGKRRIPQSVALISEKAPVFHLQHPEDHAWIYFAIHKGEVAGSLEIEFETQKIQGDRVFESLTLFGFDDEVISELRNKIKLDTTEIDQLFILPGMLSRALSTEIDFISYQYVADGEEYYKNIVAKK